MKMEGIGFYTLSDARVRNVSDKTPLWRCELLITDACNFSCPYCRGCDEKYRGTISGEEWKRTLDIWIGQGLKNVRFSGGEPTLHKQLIQMVDYCRQNGVEHIAISSNGSARRSVYTQLLAAGANDFSISLDACCASKGDEMAGGIAGAWETVVDNIRYLSKRTYVTVGVVLNESNVEGMVETVKFAHDLGVADIRIISAAQYNQPLTDAIKIPQEILDAHPILKYRVARFNAGYGVRGLAPTDSRRCALVLDDMAVLGGMHFPCIIYLREGGRPIGKLGDNVREQRKAWSESHDTHADPICVGNCLDVCVAYNNQYREFHGEAERKPLAFKIVA
jgi:MoaA/NifB/PqqE/SkfB family radical SAM enzyme